MAICITVSKSACLLLGAALGVTIACITPSSVPDDKKNPWSVSNDKEIQTDNNNTFKDVATNISKINEEKESKLYGNRTVNGILESVQLKIRQIWVQRWRVVLLNSRTSSTIGSDDYVDAQTSFPKTDNEFRGNFDPILDSGDTDSISTIYTPVGQFSVSKHSSISSRFKKKLNDIAKGYRRSNSSKNDIICKNYPRQSTLIDSGNKSTVQGITADENTTTSESRKNRKLVLNFKTTFSPIMKVFEAAKRSKREKKYVNERSDANLEIKNSNDIRKNVKT